MGVLPRSFRGGFASRIRKMEAFEESVKVDVFEDSSVGK